MQRLDAKLIYEKTLPDGKAPTKAHPTDSGFDVFAPTGFTLKPRERKTIDIRLKFKIKLPFVYKFLNFFGACVGIELQARGKSGLASKDGIEVFFGTIDEGYRGWVKIPVHNTSDKEKKWKKGEKMCQLVPTLVLNRIKFEAGKVDDETARGKTGFGDSGK